jgi:hypothetical protein
LRARILWSTAAKAAAWLAGAPCLRKVVSASPNGLGENARELPREGVSKLIGNCGGMALREEVEVDNPYPPLRPLLRSWLLRPRGEWDRDGVPSSGKMRWAKESKADVLGGDADRDDDSKLERGGGCRMGIGVEVAEDAAWKASRRCWRSSSKRGISVR